MSPRLSEHYLNRQPSAIRKAQILFQSRTDKHEIDVVNLAIGNISLPMHSKMLNRLNRLGEPNSPFSNGVVRYSSSEGTKECKKAIINSIAAEIPNNNIYDEFFERLWKGLKIKRGSKFKAYKEFNKINVEEITNEQMARIYNNQIKGIEDNKFVPHFSTWLSQRRWEMEDENNPMPDIIDRLVNLGYIHKGTDGNFELFNKDGKNYKIDIFDEKHQMQLIQ